MIIGIIYTAFNMQDYLPRSIAPWVAARTSRLDDHQFVIAAVSVPFIGFPNEGRDSTADILRKHLEDKEIDHLITGDQPMAETEARGAALTWLKSQDVEVVIQVDADEVYSERDISRLFRFVESQPYIGWFRVSLVNLVIDKKTRLTDPFTPPRIHRIRFTGVEATHFSGDNDIAYGPRAQETIANLTIPETVAAPKHLSWVADDEVSCARCRGKIRYQLEGRGWPQCSFAWDDDKGLIFNPSLLKPRTQPA